MMKLYVTHEVLWFLAIFYAPIVLWLFWKLWRALPKNLTVRVLGVVVISALAIAIPLGDVLSTSIKMAELCPQVGTFIHRTARVEGFYTDLGTPDMLKRGFKYIEASKPGDKIVLYRKDAEPLEFDAKAHQIKSRYEFIYNERIGAYQGDQHIGIDRSVVRDRETGAELGYTLNFTAYPGWIDQNTFGLFGRFTWACPTVRPAQTVQEAKSRQLQELPYSVLLPLEGVEKQ